MDSIRQNVRNLNRDERLVYENSLGQELAEDQQVITPGSLSQQPENDSWNGAANSLPDWCGVYAGLSDAETEEIEKIVLQRSNISRPHE